MPQVALTGSMFGASVIGRSIVILSMGERLSNSVNLHPVASAKITTSGNVATTAIVGGATMNMPIG